MSAEYEYSYPVRLTIDYPEEGLDRVRSAFRLVLIVPVALLYALVGGETFQFWTDDQAIQLWLGGGGFLFLPTAAMIVVREKYPRWWFDWNIELLKFQNRLFSYLFLLRDEYPSTDEEQAVHVEVAYPESLSRWLPLVKWLLAIPHYFLLFVLSIGVFFAVIIAWFAILITGSYPRVLFDFVVDVMRWGNRVTAYAVILTTDRYPPFVLGQ